MDCFIIIIIFTETKNMNHLPLFAGINGFGLAADWMGWNQTAHCEIDEFCQKIIQYYWPKSIPHYDITKTDFKKYANKIDILSGGFPCQPYSVAGKRKGKDDDRHLWPEMLRAIKEIRPTWVVGENVRGLVNWSGGMVFEEVQTDLENQGYKVWAFILPACGVNAPHRRDRVWFVAYRESKSGRRQLLKRSRQGQFRGCDSERTFTHFRSLGRYNGRNNWKKRYVSHDLNGYASQNKSKRDRRFSRFGTVGSTITNTNGRRQSSKEYRQTKSRRTAKKSISNDWQNFPTQSPICSRNDGISSRLDGITFPKWRNESIKAAGNAIVPQVAHEIFKVIEEINATLL